MQAGIDSAEKENWSISTQKQKQRGVALTRRRLFLSSLSISLSFFLSSPPFQ